MVNILKLQADLDDNTNIGTAVVIDDIGQCKGILNSGSYLRILTQNIRSINKNFDGLTVLLQQLEIEQDIIILTECWLSKVNLLPTLPNYNRFNTKRNLNKNDGVVMFIRKSLQVKVIEPQNTKELTCLVACLKDTNIIGIYRPPEFTNLDNFTHSLEFILQDFTQNNLILMGDLNIDIKNGCNAARCDSYLEITAMYGLTATHNFLTTDKSCLDHCLVKTKLPISTIVCQTTLTNHACVIVSLSQKNIIGKSTITFNKKIDYDSVIKQLKSIEWNILLKDLNANDATDTFLAIVMTALDSNTTYIKFSARKRNIKPWITPGLIRCMKHRDRLHSKLRKDPNNVILKISYVRYRNTCRKVLNTVKQMYYRNKLNQNKSKPKIQWDCVREICYLNKDKQTSAEILTLKTSPKESLDYANEYFAGIGAELANNIIQRTQTTEDKLLRMIQNSRNCCGSFYLNPTDKYEIVVAWRSEVEVNNCSPVNNEVPIRYCQFTADILRKVNDEY
ncbi:unnamed protein product, partial [Brenthis ino]